MRKTIFILSIALAGCGAAPTPESQERSEAVTASLVPPPEKLPSCGSTEAPLRAGAISLDARSSAGLVTVRLDGVAVCADTSDGVDQFLLGFTGGGIQSRIAPGDSDPMPANGDDPAPAGDGTNRGSSDPMPAHGR